MLITAPVVHAPSRVAGLRRLAVLDTPVEESFDRITRLAASDLAAAEDPDRTLLVRARGGDAAALGELYDRHGPAMWAVACAAASEEVAEEAVAEALLRPRGALLSPRGSVRARLMALARECARDQGPCPSSPCALAQLPEEERGVVELAWYGKLPVEEIAAELALPPGVVKRRMLAGLHRLRGAVAAR